MAEPTIQELLSRIDSLESKIPKPLAQGPSSGLDSDTLDGYQVSKPTAPAPNTLVPVGTDGKLPASVIPSSAMTLVETKSVSAVTSVSFTGLAPGTRYILSIDYLQNTSAGDPYLRFNADSGANYRWALKQGYDNTDETSGVSTGDTNIRLTRNSGYTVGAAAWAMYRVEFKSVSGDDTIVLAIQDGYIFSGTTITGRISGGGKYDGAAALTSVQFHVGAGTVTGTFKLYSLN